MDYFRRAQLVRVHVIWTKVRQRALMHACLDACTLAPILTPNADRWLVNGTINIKRKNTFCDQKPILDLSRPMFSIIKKSPMIISVIYNYINIYMNWSAVQFLFLHSNQRIWRIDEVIIRLMALAINCYWSFRDHDSYIIIKLYAHPLCNYI